MKQSQYVKFLHARLKASGVKDLIIGNVIAHYLQFLSFFYHWIHYISSVLGGGSYVVNVSVV